ncbi:MAG: DUF3597 domain-containing protein [Anaerolineales bacterium]|nr:DUF3597 domain-containing protein [Anaerolineales bacterium]
MGLFNTILEKLGIHKNKAEESAKPAAASSASAAAPASAPKAASGVASAGAGARMAPKTAMDDAAPRAISEVDVVKQLEGLAKGKDLNWKVSIVDLLKLLDLDSSREARTELAKELNCPEDMMGDSAKMNTWLHKEVLRKIAANGGNIPKDLLD